MSPTVENDQSRNVEESLITDPHHPKADDFQSFTISFLSTDTSLVQFS